MPAEAEASRCAGLNYPKTRLVGGEYLCYYGTEC